MSAVATLTPRQPELSPEEAALLAGDLSKLSQDQRASLIASVCRSLGLNPLTQPFSYIMLNGRLTLYTRKDATDQLRKLHVVSVVGVEHQLLNDVLFVVVKVQDRTGRIDQDMGAVNVAGLRGEALANAYMKALTKGKRRATLSICGLGMLDDSEADSIPNAVRVVEEVPPSASVHVLSDGRTMDKISGEIKPKRKELADGERAPDKWLAQLADLRTQYLSLVPDATVYIPDPLSVAEAKRLKAWLTEQIASALDAGNSEDDGALEGVI